MYGLAHKGVVHAAAVLHTFSNADMHDVSDDHPHGQIIVLLVVSAAYQYTPVRLTSACIAVIMAVCVCVNVCA